MLSVEIDREDRIAILIPKGPLSEADFIKASETIDPVIAENDGLLGLIISTKDFPGWDSFGALVKHIKFVQDHHTKLSKVAIVTDSKLGDLAETVGNHFLAANIRHYAFDDLNDAKNWIVNNETN